MRILLTISALVMASIIALQFAGKGDPVRPFENMMVVVLYAGDGSGTQDLAIQRGFRAAAQDLGCEIRQRSTTWDPEIATVGFQEAMSIGPYAICIMGYPAQDQLMPYLADARELEIVVTSYNAPFPAGEEEFSREGFGFAGTDGHAAGTALIEAAIKKHQLAPGSTALLIGDLDHPATSAFREGCLTAFHGGGVSVGMMKTPVDTLRESMEEVKAQLGRLRDTGDLPDLICYTERRLYRMADTIKDLGLAPGDVPLVGIHVAPDAYNPPDPQAWNNYVSLYVGEDVSLQAYLAVLQACISRTYGAQGLHINTPFHLFDRDNPPKADDASTDNLFIQRS